MKKSPDHTLLCALQAAQRGTDSKILRTPTGKRREMLTVVNIHLLHAIDALQGPKPKTSASSRAAAARPHTRPQTPNDVLRAAGMNFGRQDSRKNGWRSKWGVKGVSAFKISDASVRLQALPGVVSARLELVQDTRYNEAMGALRSKDGLKMFILRTSVEPTSIHVI